MRKMEKILIILGLVIFFSNSIIFAEAGRIFDNKKAVINTAVDKDNNRIEKLDRGITELNINLVAAEATGDINPTTDLHPEEVKTDDSTTNNSDNNNTPDITNNNVPKTNGDQKTVVNTSPNKPVIHEPIQQTDEETVLSETPVITSESTQSSTSPITLESVLAGFGAWWLANQIGQQLWYLFLLTGFILYLFKLKQLRRPLLFASILLLGFYLGSSLDPIGAIFSLLPNDNFSFDGAIILLGIIVLVSLIFGRIYCGWICPIGAIQEFIYPELKKQIIPSAMDTILKYFKYIVLVVVLYFSWRTGNNLWGNYEPLKALVHFGGSTAAVFVLILTLIISVLIERPFCRYICPLGAILSLTAKLAPFKMRADANFCMVCGKCSTGDCPTNAIYALNPVTDLPQIDGSECISCLRCQRNCQRFALRVSMKRIDRVRSM